MRMRRTKDYAPALYVSNQMFLKLARFKNNFLQGKHASTWCDLYFSFKDFKECTQEIKEYFSVFR